MWTSKRYRAIHLNVRKCCVPLYDDEEDWEREHDEDEDGNIRIRKSNWGTND